MIYAYIGIIISIISFFYAKKRCHRLLNPVTIFSVIWSSILFLSSLKLYDLNACSDLTYLRFLLGVIFFFVGFFVNYDLPSFRLYKDTRNNDSNEEYIIDESKYKLLYIIVVFMIVYNIPYLTKSVRTLLSGGNLSIILSNFRQDSYMEARSLRKVMNNLIVGPMSYAIYPVCAYNIIKKRKSLLSIMIVLLMIMELLKNGGRTILIYFFLSLLVAFSYSKESKNFANKTKRFIRKNKRRFIGFAVLIMLIFAIASYSRTGSYLLLHSYYYFSMQPTMFEQWASIVDASGLYGFGEASLNGFTFYPLYIFKNIFNLSFPEHWYSIYNMVLDTDHIWMPITYLKRKANAYVSVFWFFYLDGRELGIILFSLIYGAFCSNWVKKVKRDSNMKNICLYSMVLFTVFDTYVRMRFFVSDFVGGFLLLSFFFFKHTKRTRNA